MSSSYIQCMGESWGWIMFRYQDGDLSQALADTEWLLAQCDAMYLAVDKKRGGIPRDIRLEPIRRAVGFARTGSLGMREFLDDAAAGIKILLELYVTLEVWLED